MEQLKDLLAQELEMASNPGPAIKLAMTLTNPFLSLGLSCPVFDEVG